MWQTGPRTGAHIPLVNDEVLAQLATSGSAQTTGIAGSSATPLLSPPTLAKPSQKSHKAQPPPSKFAALARLPHKYKNLVQAIKNLETKDEAAETATEQLSKRRLQEVADQLVANATSSE